MPDPARQRSLVYGPLLMSASALTVTLSASIIKWASHAFSTEFILLLRFSMSTLLLLAIHPRSFPADLRACLRPSLLALQAVCLVSGMFSFYMSLRYISLVDGLLLVNTSPIFAPLFSWLIFKKTERPGVWAGIAIGMAGVAVVLRPGTEAFQPAALLALAGGALVGLQLTINSELIKREGHKRISLSVQFYAMVLTGIATLIVGTGPPDWQKLLFTNPEWSKPWLEFPLLALAAVALGLFSALTQMLAASSYKFGGVGQVTPFKFMGVIYAGVIGWLVWGTEPSLMTLCGFLLVLAGGVLALLGGRARHHHETHQI